MSFLYMADKVENVTEGIMPSNIDIPNDFTISVEGTTLVSSFTGGTSFSPQEFVDKLNNDLGLGSDLVLGEDYYTILRVIKESYPGIELLDAAFNNDVKSRLSNIDNSIVNINPTIAVLNNKLDSLLHHINNK